MRKIFVASSLVACITLVLGCPLKKKGDADAAADAALVDTDATAAAPVADAAVAPALVTAKNTADVARFPGETAIASEAAKLTIASIVRTSPKGGATVTTLGAGTDVTKMADYQTSNLVTFADPKDASATLMGWVGKESFTAVVHNGGVRDAAAPVDAGRGTDPKLLVCPMGRVSVVLSPGNAVCRKRCTKDSDCKGGAVGACGPASTVAGSVAKVCIAE